MKAKSHLIHLNDSKFFPIAEVRSTLRKFGNQHGFYSSEVLSKALDIPEGTLDNILYSTTSTRVYGSTKTLVEKRIRNYDPSVCPEKVVKKEDFARILEKFKKEFGFKTSEMSRVLDIPQSTLKHWMSPQKRGRNFRAKVVRPVLIKMQEYRIERGRILANESKLK